MEDKKKKWSVSIVTGAIKLIFQVSLYYLTRLLDTKSIYKSEYIVLHQEQTEEGYPWKQQQENKGYPDVVIAIHRNSFGEKNNIYIEGY